MNRAENITDLSNKTAVVIGGTSGLGRAIALGLARSGANVIATGRREDLVEEVCAEIEKAERETLRKTVDVLNRESIDGLRDAVIKRFGAVDILVNAAGRTAKSATAEVSEVEWQAILDTNLNGTLRACQSFYEPLKKSGTGKIINIASLASFVAFHEVAAYGASKAAVLALTKSLGCEWARSGICVNALVPGVFPTELNEKLLNGTERGREILTRTPMKRFGRAEELVGAAVFLSSDAASFITGQSIAVDGGYLASGVNS
ncbi:MAG TPA: glucose 1-dehydrogenase [Pyrinomonadaceae bacterium]|nr:glucose 1-dehydrogenase [Acidobacteriota bacterium]HXG83911.1 glucose 1-dehydrogenase [Pyrinomonadaceae bacterium]